MSLPPKRRQSPAEGEFLFELDPEPLQEAMPAYGGIPVFLRAVRSLDVGGRANRHLQLKQRQRGFDEGSYVESFLVLNALGGECLDDFGRLREDEGLPQMLGHEVPSPEAARKFLYQFHDEQKMEQAQRELAARYYRGFIPTITVIDRKGNVIYNRAGETSSSRGGTSKLEALLNSAK